MARQANQAEIYGGQLDGLAKELGAVRFRADRDHQHRDRSPARLAQPASARRPTWSPPCATSSAQPNAFVTVSTDLLRAAAADPINRHDPITDVILGTRIRGRGHTTGTVSLATIPNDKMAIIKLTTDGRVVSQNVGYNGPAVIRSTGFTDFDATQLVEFTDIKFPRTAGTESRPRRARTSTR